MTCFHYINTSSEYKHVCKNQPFQNTNFYDRFKLFNISHIYLYFTAVQFYKYNFCNHSEYFHNRIENDQILHSHLTRFRNNNYLTLPFPCIVKYKHSFYYIILLKYGTLCQKKLGIRKLCIN